MSFRQPTPTTIRSYHFRGNAYEFPVESVLESTQGGGQLLIKASTGYLLTSLADTEPQSEQTLDYILQPDGSWVARTVITLLANGSSLVSGTITLSDPAGEILTVVVDIETFLTISDSSITFDKIEPGEEEFVILKISQQGTNTPATLSTDNPNQFSLASSKKELQFTSNLVVTPAFGGAYIQIRYAPNRSGQHKACLFVKTPYDTQTVSLQGSAGRPWWSGLWTRWEALISQPMTMPDKKVGIPAILLVGGLLSAGYIYRCQLAPSWCQSQIEAEPFITSPDSTVLNTDASTADVNNEGLTNALTKETDIDKKAGVLNQIGLQKSESTPQLTVKINTEEPLKSSQQAKPHHQARVKRHILSKSKSVSKHDESDLEKALNSKDY